ncbi:MAG: hypothetical protein K6G92_13440 [Bacteroidaceae bacterium]|nr:hypothetical protein [Bacteroidaceae bacterium]
MEVKVVPRLQSRLGAKASEKLKLKLKGTIVTLLSVFTFSIFQLFTLSLFSLSAYAISDDAMIDWGAPIVEAGRTGCVYPIKYTKTDPTAATNWNRLGFDDSSWTDGFGPIANTGFGGTLGTTFDDVNDGEYNVWFRRYFTLEESFFDKDVWLACGHDDEGAIYIDGKLLVSWGNEWNSSECIKLSKEQTRYLTKGYHVFSIWAKNNFGGFYYDCGLYGKATVDWNVPYLVGARSGVQYDILYTRSRPSGTTWTTLDFDDSGWKTGKGPIGDISGPEGTAPVGLKCAANDGEYNLWFRRHFTLSKDITEREVWLACGHDDEGAIYIDGVKIVGWGNEWDYARFQKLTDAQKALLTEGDHVMAVWAKNNFGGYYFDCGLYGVEGDEPLDLVLAEVSVDFSTWEEHPLVKKFGAYQTPWVRSTELNRDLPKLAQLEARSMRYEMCWGNNNAYGEPSISGTKDNWTYNFTNYDNLFRRMRQNSQALIVSHGYCPSIINNGDNRNVPSDWNVWTKINRDWAEHWKKLNLGNEYIEVWNEPDCGTMFFLGTMEEYFDIYKYAAPAIVEGNPDLKVGGPVSALNNWHDAFGNFVMQNNLPWDFVSCHAYGTPGWQFSTIHDVLKKYNRKETEILMTEFAPYGTGAPIWNDGPVEKAEHAMRFFNVVPEFLSTIDLSHVTWAQYIDVVDGNGNTLVGADKMGLLDGSTGKRKAIFNAFKLYGWMPLQRASVSTNTSLQGLASKDDNCVCVVLWNNSPRTMPISLSLSDIPFGKGYIEVYRIDEEHNSWYETHRDNLTPEYAEDIDITDGKQELSGIIGKRGVWFVRIMADKEKSSFEPVEMGHVVRTHQYYNDGRESTCPYAYFDAKTWTTSLSLNQMQTGWAVVGVTAENLPDVIHVSSTLSDGIRTMGRNAALAVHIEYQTAEGYTKHDVYSYNSLAATRRQFAPWETQTFTSSTQVEDFSDFNIPLKAEAPEGWTGRVIITYELSSMGKGAKADIRLTPGSEDETPVNEELRMKNEESGTAIYNLAGQRLPDKMSDQGVVITGRKKILRF